MALPRAASVDENLGGVGWWLLLQATGSVGPDGDRLAHTTFVQPGQHRRRPRPKGACDPAVDKEARVPYPADYFFWKATGGA